MANILTVYFSLKGETLWKDMTVKNLEKGNTAVVTEFIQKAVGGDLFEIETTSVYSGDHFKMIYEAKEEMDSGRDIEPKYYPDNLDMYDTIFVGYPNWWSTMPPVVATFLKHYDLSGKRIIPFCTHGGGGWGHSLKDLQEVCSGAVIEKGFDIVGTMAAVSEDAVSAWAKNQIRT